MSDQTPEPYTPTRDELWDAYRLLRKDEIGGDPLLAAIQSSKEFEGFFEGHDREFAERASKTAWAEGAVWATNRHPGTEVDAAYFDSVNPYDKAGESQHD